MSDRLQQLEVFVRVAEGGSFTEAATAMHLSQPSASRIVSELEERLETKLFFRSTRRVTLTQAGATFLQRAKEILGALDDAEATARRADSLRGTLRLAVTALYGTRVVIPTLPKFVALHPYLRVDVSATDEMQDLVASGVDISVRIGAIKGSLPGARRVTTLNCVVVAAPSYVAVRGIPKTPADLTSHDCILGPGRFRRSTWKFSHEGVPLSASVAGRVACASAPAVLAAAVAGLGIAQLPEADIAAELRSGTLIRMLSDFSLEPVLVHAVFPSGSRLSAKVRAFYQFLVAELRPASPPALRDVEP